MTASGTEPDRDREHDRGAPGGTAGRIARGLAANGAGNGITALIQLVSVPLLLANWGVDAYGTWLVLSAVPTYLGLSDVGFASAAGTSMTVLAANGRRQEAVRLGREAWSFTTATSGIAILVSISICWILIPGVSSTPGMSEAEARSVITALMLQVLVSVQYGVLDAWYRSGGRYPLGVAMRQFGRMLEFSALVAIVTLGGGPGDAAIAILLSSMVGLGLSLVVLRRVVPWASFRPVLPTGHTVRRLIAPGLAFLAFPLANAISVQGFVIVIGAVLGASAVVTWSTTRTLTRMALQFMTSINLSIWPELSRALGNGEYELARTIQRRAVQLAIVGSLLISLPLAIFGPAFIDWWTRGAVVPPPGLLGIFLLVIIASSIWFTSSAVLVATNRHARMAVVYLAGVAAALAIAVPLTTLAGLAGAALTLLVVEAAMAAYVVPASLVIVRDAPRPFARSLVDVPAVVQEIQRRTHRR